MQAQNCSQIFEKAMLEATASLAVKVSAGNMVGEEVSLCQEVGGRDRRGPFHT
jgi:hypothetical protein